MKLTSPAFINNGELPAKYTCDGQGINPPLKIAEIPASTQSLVLIFDDPDAVSGTYVHWTVWNIPAEAMNIPEHDVPNNSVQGLTSAGTNSYVPPCPPSGIHRYTFKVYCLDTKLNLPTDSDVNYLEKAMQGHILDSAQIIGLYQRK